MSRLPGEIEIAASWSSLGHQVALATVMATWGSSPRQVGSMLAVRGDGIFQGSVSGGCVEAAVITEALAALQDGRQRDLSFGVSDDQAWEAGLACGGRIRIVVEPLSGEPAALEEILSRLNEGETVGRQVVIGGGEWRMLDATATDETSRRCLAEDRSLLTVSGSEETFLHVLSPLPRLVIIGAVHIAQYLAPMAILAGYDVTIVDSRTAFANADRFGSATLVTQLPDAALTTLKPDCNTAIVTLTHDAKLDDPALLKALGSSAGYIGALGSRKTHVARLERLKAFGAHGLDRIDAPAGLDIGALTPAEIAVSIMAGIVRQRRQPGP